MPSRRTLWVMLVVGVVLMVGSVSVFGWVVARHMLRSDPGEGTEQSEVANPQTPAEPPSSEPAGPPDDFIHVVPRVTPLPPGTEPALGQYIGCFKDTSALDLDGFLVRWPTNNTPQHCMATCTVRGFRYAAVQYGESCLCGQTYGRYGPAEKCDSPCPGDVEQMCGGYSANSVYRSGAK